MQIRDTLEHTYDIMSVDPKKRVGEQVGNYRLMSWLGRGAFADVYLGEHIYLKKQSAIKMLHVHLSEKAQKGFLNEACLVAQLNHPNIVRVLDYGLENGTPFLVMAYAPNGSLRQRFPEGTCVPLEQVIPLVQQMAAALDYAHQHKVIHRDVKPENMLIGAENQILLSDFGLALPALTVHSQVANVMAGTALYMAPELLERNKAHFANDQYALGVVTYEWLCGQCPFMGSSFVQIGTQHVLAEPPSLCERVPNLPLAAERVVLKALAKDRTQRYDHVTAFANALQDAYTAATSIPAPLSMSPSLWPLSERQRESHEMPPSSESVSGVDPLGIVPLNTDGEKAEEKNEWLGMASLSRHRQNESQAGKQRAFSMQGKLHQYHLIKELATKYSHTTYLASPTDEPERQVVLTVFASSLFSLPERKLVLQKAQRIQELEYPNLVPILDMAREDEQPFVVREYLPQESLRDRLSMLSSDRMPLRDALMIISRVGQALAYAHTHDIFHGNLKPENIFLDANGEVLLTGFSLVARKDAILRDQALEEYAFCYLAPEQFAGPSDARSDQYALGCLAYELIAGHVPFAARSLASLMGHHNTISPSPLSESVANLPPSLDAAILKTLAKDPVERFVDFSLFLEVIQSVLLLPPVFSLSRTVDSRKQKTTSRPTRRLKAWRVLSPAVPPIPAPESLQAEAIEQSEERIPTTTKRVFDSDQRDPQAYIYPKTTNDDSRKSNSDRVRKPLVSEASFSQEQNDLDQTLFQEDDADDLLLINLFGEQESNDLPAPGSRSLRQEQHESSRDTRDEMTTSLPRESDGDMPVRRRTQHSRTKLLGLIVICFVVVASGTYAAFFPLRTSKPNRPVRPTQATLQAVIPAQISIFPTRPAAPATLTVTVQPTARASTAPAVIPTPTPAPSPVVVHQTITIDDAVVGTGLNQFNYVGGGWVHYTNNNACYDGTWSLDGTTGDYLTVSFTGIQIKFYAATGPKGGIGAISVDGGSETMVDFYSASFLGDQLRWTSPTMPEGSHTFKLRVTGNKDADSDGYNVGVDRVNILS